MNPNFLVAGVAKCGTTSLFYYLIQHPEVSIPKKETFYFISEFYKNQTADPIGRRDPERIITSLEDYQKLYAESNTKVIGEVSTCYFHFHEMAIPKIKSLLGDPKIIIILRHPVERAYSGYKHFTRTNHEPLSFEEALRSEKERKDKKWDFMWQYSEYGFYAKQVKAYQTNFTNVKIILSEDLEKNTDNTMREIFQFLEIDDSFKPDTKVKFNISDSQKNNFWFKYFIHNKITNKILKPIAEKLINPVKRRKIIHMLRTPEKQKQDTLILNTRQKLLDLYKEDTLELQSILKRDLSTWLK